MSLHSHISSSSPVAEVDKAVRPADLAVARTGQVRLVDSYQQRLAAEVLLDAEQLVVCISHC